MKTTFSFFLSRCFLLLSALAVFAQNGFSSDLVKNLHSIHNVDRPRGISIPESCKFEKPVSSNGLESLDLKIQFQQEVCDDLMHRLLVTEAHLSKNADADPSFYESYERPPAICETRNAKRKFENDTSVYCVFNGIRESVKYELYSLFGRSCLKSKVTKSEIDAEWNRLSKLCKQNGKTGDYFSCFSESTKVLALKESFSDLARLTSELDLLQDVCSKSFPDRRKNHCLSDEHLRFKETIRDQDVLKFDLHQLEIAEPGFEYDLLPDYYALYNSCDRGRQKRKRFASHPNLKQKAVVQCGNNTSTSPLTSSEAALYQSLCTQAEQVDKLEDQDKQASKNKGSATPEVKPDEKTIKKVIQLEIAEVLDSKIKSDETRETIKKLTADQKYLDSTTKKYLKFADKLQKKKIESKEIVFQISEDYSKSLKQYILELERKRQKDIEIAKEKKAESEKLNTPEPLPKQSAEEDPSPIVQKTLPTGKELVALAKAGVDSFRKKEKDPTNYSDFFSRLESDGAKPEADQKQESDDFIKKWKPYADQYEKIGNQKAQDLEKIKKLLVQMNKDFLKKYFRSNATITGLLDGKGGNCEARMKALLAGLDAAQLDDIAGYKPVIEFYKDHVQLMLYNEEKNKVLDAITGITSTAGRVNLYDPRVLQFGYLKVAGEKPKDLEFNDFIVKKADPKFAQHLKSGPQSGGTNSNLSKMFPSSSEQFTDAAIPLYSESSEPSFTSRPTKLDDLPDFVDWDELSSELKDEYSYLKNQLSLIPYSRHYTGDNRSVYIFRNSFYKNKFEELQNSNSKKDAEMAIELQAMNEYVETKNFKEVSELIRNPDQLLKLSSKDFSRFLQNFYLMTNAVLAINHFQISPDAKFNITEESYKKLARLGIEIPKKINQNPEVYFEMLENASDASKKAFLEDTLTSYFMKRFAERGFDLGDTNQPPVPWHASLAKYMVDNVGYTTESTRRRSFDYSLLNETKVNKTQISSENAEGILSVSPNPKTSAEVGQNKKGKPKKKKYEYSISKYLYLLEKLDMKVRYSFFTDSFIKDVYDSKDPSLIFGLNRNLSNFILGGYGIDQNKLFPGTPRLYDGPFGKKIPHQIARAVFELNKYLFSARDLEAAEREITNRMNEKALSKYASAYEYTVRLGQALKKNGVDVDTNIKMYPKITSDPISDEDAPPAPPP